MNRFVPLSVKIKCLCGSAFLQVGCVLLAFCSLFIFLLFPQVNLGEPFYFSGAVKEATGTVVGEKETNASEGGGKHSRGRPITGYQYTFTEGDQTYQGTSYSSTERPTIGSQVRVEFPPGDPAHSRIRGFRMGVFPFWTPLIISIFPVIGLLLSFFGLKRGLRNLSLFRNGILTKAKFVRKQGTNVTVNNRPVMEYFFQFTTRDGRKQEFSTKTSIGDAIMDDAEEPILYDPQRPERAVTLDNLPGRPQFDQQGNITGGTGTVLSAALPVLVLYIYAVGIWWNWLR